jgi:hypothetical protein
MNLDNLRILQDNLAGLAFTIHFDMGTWSAPRCGTTLCLAGLGTTLELSKTSKDHEPSLDNLSTETLYKELHEQFIEFHDLNFYVFHACKYIAIPYDNLLSIWHFGDWPLAIKDLYIAKDPYLIKKKYIELFPASNLKAYAIPAYFWKTLAGYLALEAFYEYTPKSGNLEAWVTASSEDIEGYFIPEEETPYEYLPKWLTKYSDRIIHFEQIAIQSEPAKEFLYKD